ncbi:MAG TPA: GspH/FimT family pseudopilin [Gemmatimonadales bacterium]|jgi:prepilin-type N-terminal cleavage/methylation domain-containing protein|nr:GspH/FimT family pseudopilin [Gemmatimonadales bacterium]
MSRGVTLPELLLALVVVGLLSLIALPKLAAVTSANALRHEATQLVAALDAARTAAIRVGAPSTLTLSDSSYTVIGGLPGDSVRAWRIPGPGTRGVQLTGAGGPIRFGASGLAIGVANRTLTLTRGSSSRRVVLSRLGRITP